MNAPNSLQKGVDALNTGRTREARRYLGQYVREQPDDPQGWWALAQVLDSAEQKMDCLRQVLRLEPDHREAQVMMRRLKGQIAAPTPAEGLQRPILTAREDGTVDLPRPELENEPPTTDNRDLYVAGAAVIIALLAIVGTVVLVATGSGASFGFNPPDSTPTPIALSFGTPACTRGADAASIVFINNTALTVTVARDGEDLFILAPGEQRLDEVEGGVEFRYVLHTDDERYQGIPASIQVPARNACRVPIE